MYNKIPFVLVLTILSPLWLDDGNFSFEKPSERVSRGTVSDVAFCDTCQDSCALNVNFGSDTVVSQVSLPYVAAGVTPFELFRWLGSPEIQGVSSHISLGGHGSLIPVGMSIVANNSRMGSSDHYGLLDTLFDRMHTSIREIKSDADFYEVKIEAVAGKLLETHDRNRAILHRELVVFDSIFVRDYVKNSDKMDELLMSCRRDLSLSDKRVAIFVSAFLHHLVARRAFVQLLEGYSFAFGMVDLSGEGRNIENDVCLRLVADMYTEYPRIFSEPSEIQLFGNGASFGVRDGKGAVHAFSASNLRSIYDLPTVDRDFIDVVGVQYWLNNVEWSIDRLRKVEDTDVKKRKKTDFGKGVSGIGKVFLFSLADQRVAEPLSEFVAKYFE